MKLGHEISILISHKKHTKCHYYPEFITSHIDYLGHDENVVHVYVIMLVIEQFNSFAEGQNMYQFIFLCLIIYFYRFFM